MIRSILAFVVAYIVMAVLVMAGFLVGPLSLGVERVFEPGTYTASTLWQWLAAFIGLLGATAGGAVCRAISRGPRTPIVLAAVAVLFAGITGAMQSPAPDPVPARPAEQSFQDLMKNASECAREPVFTRVSNPIVAGVGILLGSALVGCKRKPKGH